MRRPMLVANWKMNKINEEAARFIMELRSKVAHVHDKDIVVCPSFVSIVTAFDCAKGSNILIGAQDMHQGQFSALTGAVSAPMLKDFCRYVMIGHSERRIHFKETDGAINQKLKSALKNGITPIFCIGENFQERQEGRTQEILMSELSKGLKGFKALEIRDIVIAYEPVWAISSGDPNHQPATQEDAQKEHAFIRRWLNSNYKDMGEQVRIIYGGSVKPDNIKGLMQQPDIDGGLVGNASLDADSFAKIVTY